MLTDFRTFYVVDFCRLVRITKQLSWMNSGTTQERNQRLDQWHVNVHTTAKETIALLYGSKLAMKEILIVIPIVVAPLTKTRLPMAMIQGDG